MIRSTHPIFEGFTYSDVEVLAQNTLRLANVPGFGGLGVKDGQPSAYQWFQKPFSLQQARFVRVRGQNWLPDPKIALNGFPFATGQGAGAVVPLVGDIYVGRRALSDVELSGLGLDVIRDNKERVIRHPFFAPPSSRAIYDGVTGRV